MLPYLDTPSHLTLFYEVKADLSEEDVQHLSEARIKFIQPGIEALATSTLKLMKKGTNAFQNLRLLRNCVMYDVYPIWNLLIGFPGEEEDVYKKYVHDMPLLTHLPPPSGVFPVRFDRFSPYFTQPEQYALDLHPCDYYEMIFPFGEETLKNLAYYFVDNNFGAAYVLNTIRWLDKLRNEFNMWWKLWHAREVAELHPQLFFKEGKDCMMIYDSRSGRAVEYQISPTTKLVLEYLAEPRRLSDLSKLDLASHFDLDEEIATLTSHGLIFEEDKRFISLVLPQEPPSMSVNAVNVYQVKKKTTNSN